MCPTQTLFAPQVVVTLWSPYLQPPPLYAVLTLCGDSDKMGAWVYSSTQKID